MNSLFSLLNLNPKAHKPETGESMPVILISSCGAVSPSTGAKKAGDWVEPCVVAKWRERITYLLNSNYSPTVETTFRNHCLAVRPTGQLGR